MLDLSANRRCGSCWFAMETEPAGEPVALTDLDENDALWLILGTERL